MYVTFKGTQYTIEPFEFKNNVVISNQNTGYTYTQFMNDGNTINLHDLYEDVYWEHANDNNVWTSDPIKIAHVKYKLPSDTDADFDVEMYITHYINNTVMDFTFTNPITSETCTIAVPFDYTYTNALDVESNLPYVGCVSFALIEFLNSNSNECTFAIVNPSKTWGNGGFYFHQYDAQSPNEYVRVLEDFNQLGVHPSFDPQIPAYTGALFNELANCCTFTAKVDTDILWNDEIVSPLSPDDDINTPDTNSGPYSDYSDPVSLDSLPSIGPLDTGFIKAYVLTVGNAQAIANFMLSDNFITNVKKLFANPIDYIISLHFLPVTPTTSTATNVIIGGVDTGVSAPRTYDNYIDFSCGSVSLDEFWGSFIDYDCTKVAIYLPFIGIRDLNTDDVMTGRLTVNYRINVIDGDFVVTIHSSTSHKLNGIISQYQGNMMMQTPVTALDYSNKVNAAFTALSSLPGIAMGNAGSVVQGAAGMLEATLSKPMIQRSGNISGGSGFLGNFTPYLIKTRPKQAVPSLFTKLFGKPSMIGGKLDDFTGYTKIAKVNLSGVACTDAERDEILQLLEEGVFV